MISSIERVGSMR